MMISFRFWQRCLVLLGIAITFYFAVFFTFSSFLNIDYSNINRAFWDSQTVPLIAVDFQRWMYGIYGAIATAFGLFIVFIASIPFKRKERWSWYCLVSCISSWFVFDTLISLEFNVHANIVSNLIIFILLMLPLVFTGQYIFHPVTHKILRE